MEKEWRTLGIIGAGRHTGVTHLAIWMANYLTGVWRDPVAVLEWNDHGDLKRMKRFCTEKSKGKKHGMEQHSGKKSYRIMEVDYFAEAGPEELAGCLDGKYQRIIVDYGDMDGSGLYECARCDRKVLVGALSEWQAETFLEAIGMDGKRDKSWRYTAAFGSEETRREIEKTFHMSLLRIPVSVDVFAVTRADMEFFEKLLQSENIKMF